MHFTRIARRGLALAVGAGLTLAAALPASASSQTAASSGWRVVKTIGPLGGDASVNFTAVSANDAWLTWAAYGLDNVVHDGVLHWTGTAWRTVPVPASLDNYSQNTLDIAAPSATDVWLFNSYNHTKVLHWNGRKWALLSIPSWVVRFSPSGDYSASALAFSASNMWVFSSGLDAATDHFVARYNGRSWTKMTLPVIPWYASAVSPTDIWVMGSTLGKIRRDLLVHWNGNKWSTVALPKVTVPRNASEYLTNLTALGPTDVWAAWDIIQGSAGAVTMYLLHWNGRSWARVSLKYPTSWVASLAPDGHGGLWISASGPKPRYLSHFYHLNDGHWSEYTYPTASSVNPATLVWIPGTRSVWAWHDFPLSSTTIATGILKYGP